MQIEITAKPVFSFAISRADVTVLTTLSMHHYDWHCKSYSKTAADVGKNGLLVIWGMYLDSAEKEGQASAEVSASRDDLDTLLKCMEMAYLHHDVDQARVDALRDAFFGALRRASELYTVWVDKYDSTPKAVTATA